MPLFDNTLDSHLTHLSVHAIFDILAWLVAAAAFYVLRKTWFKDNPVDVALRIEYYVAVLFGAGVGAWLLGSLNSWLSGQGELARSIVGALAGAIVSIELFKKLNGISARTGAIYAFPIALGIAVGRIGCLLSGLDDFTHGIPTGRPWGWDFGDDILRHPVQLYESISMASFAIVYALTVHCGSSFWRANGFYLAVAYYAAQRFFLEFLKPYNDIVLGMTIFQFLSLILIFYAASMIFSRNAK